ncbi:MAG: hypothetical protein KF893_01540 [Caldilineaceae bacterium]|nr:hypothetical protein [Caldilineaceae bacterium]
MFNSCRRLVMLLLSLIITGCIGIPTATVPQEQLLPEPVEIRIIQGEQQQTLVPADEEFGAVVAALRPVLANIDNQARTFFSPDRFAEEIEPIAYVYIRFDDDEKFSGQEISWFASELIVTQVADEALLLARTINVVDWAVYLPADPATVEGFLSALIPR